MSSDSSLALFSALLDDLKRSGCSLAALNPASELWPDASIKDARCLALVKSFYKKYIDAVSPDADSNALEKFLSVNSRQGLWEPTYLDSWDELLVGELKSQIHDFWEVADPACRWKRLPLVLSFDDIWSKGQCGPGKSYGSKFNDFYSKLFSSNLTTTSKMIYRSYRNYTYNFAEWANAENARYASYGEVCVVGENLLRFVPKTSDISRTICIEPNLNMFGQLGIGHHIEERLRTFFGLDLATQPDMNRELARIGSLTGQFSTIDLSSASDSLSMRMLQYLLPRDFFAWLKIFRSPASRLPDGRLVELNMVSTMGNGFTFPLETMLFACIVRAALKARSHRIGRPSVAELCNYGVFGDDIIVPTGFHYNSALHSAENYGDEVVRDVLRLLRFCGFEVNSSKSFFEGPFRESCGGDYFRGEQIRGVYIKTLKSVQDRFVALNRLVEWSSISGIRLSATCKLLLRSVPEQPVPPWENLDAGVKVPLCVLLPTKKRKPLYGKGLRVSKHVQSYLYRASLARTRTFFADEYNLRKLGLAYNVSGLLISFLKGDIRNGLITMRSHGTQYRTVNRIAPNWENSESVPGFSGGQRWKTAAILNLF